MIITIAGPSGSGKTTFIKYLNSVIKNLKIITVDVVSQNRTYCNELGRKNICFDEFSIRKENNIYTSICSFETSIYAFTLPNKLDNDIYLLDYPGEYPECIEMIDYNWIGVLILPPSESELIKRLNESNRETRIPGACLEYLECLEDIKNGLLNNWIVITNGTIDDFKGGIKKILKKINYDRFVNLVSI